MPDLHGWITQQIETVENTARLIAPGGYEPDDWRIKPSRSGRWVQVVAYSRTIGEPPQAAAREDTQPVALVQAGRNEHLLMAMHDPATVLRRCEADRRILNRHRLNPNAHWTEAASCDGCGDYDEMAYRRTENLNDCPELLDLAYAHGLTDEILAGLDRPADGEPPERTGPSLIPDMLAKTFAAGLVRAMTTQIIAANTPSPEEKALKILDPELKKIPVYVPVPREEPGA